MCSYNSTFFLEQRYGAKTVSLKNTEWSSLKHPHVIRFPTLKETCKVLVILNRLSSILLIGGSYIMEWHKSR
jgi:hypothetical protein